MANGSVVFDLAELRKLKPEVPTEGNASREINSVQLWNNLEVHSTILKEAMKESAKKKNDRNS